MAAPCEAHPEAPSIDSCRRCSAKLCAECRKLDGLTPYCASCLRAVRRAPWTTGLVIAAAIAVIGGGGYWTHTLLKPTYDYGSQTTQIRSYEAALEDEPCHKPTFGNLVSAMMVAGDNRGTVKRLSEFEKKCGPDPVLLDLAYQAHERLEEHDAAVEDMSKAIDARPELAYRYVLRGRAYQHAGKEAPAIKDFEEAFALSPDLTDVPLELATLYAKAGRPCAGLERLDYILARDGDAKRRAVYQTKIDELVAQGHCDDVIAATDRVSIPTARGKRDIRAKVRINGVEAGDFIVDTGATTVVTTAANAARLGLDVAHGRRIRATTANGDRTGVLVRARSVDVQGLEAERVEVVVVDDLGSHIDGLLGMSYLSRFDIHKDDAHFEIIARSSAKKPTESKPAARAIEPGPP